MDEGAARRRPPSRFLAEAGQAVLRVDLTDGSGS
jgi:hypothetical protein